MQDLLISAYLDIKCGIVTGVSHIFKYLADYRIRRCLVPFKRPTFSKYHEGGQDNGNLYFSKIFQRFPKCIFFLPKEQLDGILMIIESYLNKKNKIKYENLARSKFEGKIFCIKYFAKNFQNQDSPKFAGD